VEEAELEFAGSSSSVNNTVLGTGITSPSLRWHFTELRKVLRDKITQDERSPFDARFLFQIYNL